jgi:hypothetical protein
VPRPEKKKSSWPVSPRVWNTQERYEAIHGNGLFLFLNSHLPWRSHPELQGYGLSPQPLCLVCPNYDYKRTTGTLHVASRKLAKSVALNSHSMFVNTGLWHVASSRLTTDSRSCSRCLTPTGRKVITPHLGTMRRQLALYVPNVPYGISYKNISIMREKIEITTQKLDTPNDTHPTAGVYATTTSERKRNANASASWSKAQRTSINAS